MNHERIVQVFFFGFLALITWQIYQVIEPFLLPIGWAILLAFLVHPLLVHLHRRVANRTTCALIITIAVALGVILPALWLSARLVGEAQALYAAISDLASRGGFAGAEEWLRGTRVGAHAAEILSRYGIRLEDEIKNIAVQGAKLTSDYVIRHGSSVATNLAGFIFHFVIALLTFFYLLRDGESYFDSLRELTPLHEQDKKAIFDSLSATLSSVMRGLMLTAVLDGVAIGLGYLVCGVPYWAFLAILTAAAGLLPVGGTSIVWIPVALYLGFAVSWVPATTLAIWSIITITIVDSLIKPIAMGHGTGLPTLALFFGLAGGIEAYGPIGIFAGPAVVSIFAVLLRVFRRTYGSETAKPIDEEVEPLPAEPPEEIAPPRRAIGQERK